VNTVLPGSTKTTGVEKFVQDLFPGEPLEVVERRFMEESRPTSLIEQLIDPPRKSCNSSPSSAARSMQPSTAPHCASMVAWCAASSEGSLAGTNCASFSMHQLWPVAQE
jgi:hypothetical protein